jgi:hypothetical protein
LTFALQSAARAGKPSANENATVGTVQPDFRTLFLHSQIDSLDTESRRHTVVNPKAVA